MARLKLSAAGLTSPLDVGPSEPVTPPEAAPVIALVPPVPEAPEHDAARVAAPPPAPTGPQAAGAAPAQPAERPGVDAAEGSAAPAARETAPHAEPDARPQIDVPPLRTDHDARSADPTAVAAAPDPSPRTAPDDAPRALEGLPDWAAGLPVDRLQPDALLGRPRQTALILDVAISRRLDALAAEAGPRGTVAALITAVLHFHLPEDGDAAARAVGAYRRARLDDLDRDWEERNARLPGAVRDRVDELVAAAGRRVADVRRSTLVNALLDAHLPHDPREAARLATRLAMVRGGAFVG